MADPLWSCSPDDTDVTVELNMEADGRVSLWIDDPTGDGAMVRLTREEGWHLMDTLRTHIDATPDEIETWIEPDRG